jgi:hypothetical protein
MRLTGDMPDDITRTKALLVKLPNLGINPSMDKLTLSHVPRLVFENMIVHAGLRALAKDQQLTAILLIVREYKLFTPALGNSQSMRGYGLYHFWAYALPLMHKV